MPLVRKDSPIDRLPAGLTHAVNPTANPQLFVYESNALGSPARAGAVIAVNNIVELVDGYYLEVNGVRLFFRDAPGPGDLPSVAIAVDVDILQAIAAELRRLPEFQGDYAVLTETGEVRVKANRSGTSYNLTLGQPGAGLALSPTPGVDGSFAQSKAAYRVWLDVYVDVDEDGAPRNTNRLFDVVPSAQADFKPVDSLTKDFAGTNSFTFDVSESLKNYVRNVPPRYADPTIPDGGYPVHEPAAPMTVRFAVEAGEEWTDDTGRLIRKPRERIGWGRPTDAPQWMLWGASSALPGFLDWGQTTAQYRRRWRRRGAPPAQVDALTTQPGEKWSHVQAVEYLYYFWERGADNMTHLDVRFDFVFEDCTTLDEQYFDRFAVAFAPNLRYGGVFYTEVSPRIFDIAALEATAGARLAEMTVTIVEHDGDTANAVAVTRPQTYLMSEAERCAELATVVMWLNPLGGYDTWSPTGAVIKKGAAEQQTHDAPMTHALLPSRTLAAGYPDYARKAEVRAYAGSAVTQYEMHTGWMDAETFEWLKTLTESVEVYVIRFADPDTRGGGPIQPRRCHRPAAAEWVKNERADMYAMKVDLTLSYSQNFIQQ